MEWREEGGKVYRKGAALPSPGTVATPPYARVGGELSLSNRGQLELLRGVLGRGVPLRTAVRGVSMAPFVRDEDVLTIAPMNGRAPRVGEIIAVVLPGGARLAIHRVIDRDSAGWRVGGDNCSEADGVVTSSDILGLVVRVERRGREVRLGSDAERAWIAALNRGGQLVRLGRLWHALRCWVALALRRVRALPWFGAGGRGNGS